MVDLTTGGPHEQNRDAGFVDLDRLELSSSPGCSTPCEAEADRNRARPAQLDERARDRQAERRSPRCRKMRGLFRRARSGGGAAGPLIEKRLQAEGAPSAADSRAAFAFGRA